MELLKVNTLIIFIVIGKYASLYLKRVFFFDSNPPLGKLLLAAVAYITGFDGEVWRIRTCHTFLFFNNKFVLEAIEYAWLYGVT